MRNTENAFSPIKRFGYLSLHIGVNGDSVKVFRLFSMYLKDKTFKIPQKSKLFWEFEVTFHMYLDIGRDYDDYYDDEYYYE